MKTNEELNTVKEEVETLNRKLAELTKEELTQVNGGNSGNAGPFCIIEELCSGCGTCYSICPCGAIDITGDKYFIDSEECAWCGICAIACKTGAIRRW